MWRALASILVVVASMIGSMALARDRPPGYFEAKQAFEALPVDDRLQLQIMLTAAGYWPAVPNVQFNGRIFDAISQFQAEAGFQTTGFLTSFQRERLWEKASPALSNWGMRKISLPGRGAQIWAPLGLGLTSRVTANGLSFSDVNGHFRLDFEHYDHVTINGAFNAWLAAIARVGGFVKYKVVKTDFYAISAQNGMTSSYMRGHADASGITGFFVSYDNSDSSLRGDRLEVLISASLWSAMSPRAPSLSLPRVADPALSAPPAPSPVSGEPSPPASKPAPTSSSGTAFFVSNDGHLLTNAHVVDDCRTVSVAGPGGLVPVRMLARDTTNDLALLKSDLKAPRVAQFRAGLRLGEAVAAFGYPLTGMLSTSGNFTLGNITALSGLGDDTRFVQISASVQPGNSGGPLVDASGNLVGVVSSKLNALKVMLATDGDIPQNVNFAIKGSAAMTFLESNGVAFQTGTAGPALAPADLADVAKALGIFVKCSRN